MLRPRLRPGFFAAIGLAVAVFSIAGTLSLDRDERSLPSTDASGAGEGGPLSIAAGPNDAAHLPLIDAVRVGTKGQTAVVGRALPGAVIAVTFDGREWGGTMADGRGDWVFMPDGLVEPKNHQITIEQVSSIGRGRATLFLGTKPDGWAGSLAVALGADGTIHVLQAGGADATGVSPGLGWVEQIPDGRMVVGGMAQPAQSVEIQMDGRVLGRLRTDARGEWQVSAKAPGPGLHSLKVVRLAGADGVEPLTDLPFMFVAPGMLRADQLDIKWDDEAWVLTRPLGDGKASRLTVKTP